MKEIKTLKDLYLSQDESNDWVRDDNGDKYCIRNGTLQFIWIEGNSVDSTLEQGKWPNIKITKVPKRWRAAFGKKYFYIDEELEAIDAEEGNSKYDEAIWEVGNYFRTKKQAEQAADSVRELLLNIKGEDCE